MRANKTKAKLAGQQTVFGAFVGIPSPGVVELLAYAGLDFVVIDAEHGPMDIGSIEHMVRAADAADIDAFVRILRIDAAEIARYLDIGVLGIQIPHVDAPEDLRAVVQAVKYHPEGMRGMGFARVARFVSAPKGRADYMAWANRETMVICQVESRRALDCLPDLLQVEGVDVLFIGPSDLSQSLGYPAQRKHPVVQGAIDKAITEIRAAGKIAGTTAVDMQADMAKGVRYFTGLDARMLLNGAGQFLEQGRAAERARRR